MTKQLSARINRLEQAREAEAGRFIMWSDSDDPNVPLEVRWRWLAEVSAGEGEAEEEGDERARRGENLESEPHSCR